LLFADILHGRVNLSGRQLQRFLRNIRPIKLVGQVY
jgi:hypothetical protein